MRTKVHFTTMEMVLYNIYDYLEGTLNHLKSFKLKSYLGDNFAYFCAAILVDAETLETSVAFKPGKLGNITRTFEYTYDYIFCLWTIHNCN